MKRLFALLLVAAPALAQVSVPTFNPPAGTYDTAQSVVITCSTPGAEVYYTVDGTTPTYPPTGTTQKYTGPIYIPQLATVDSVTFNAICVALPPDAPSGFTVI